jgi:uncharacterized iron-regulated protein
MLDFIHKEREPPQPMFRFAAILLLGPLLLACAGPAVDWVSPLARDHPLAGRIWQPAGGRFVQTGELERAVAAADFVLAGEKHDNPDHHLLQARLLAFMIRAGRRPAVVFEMIGEDRQAALDGWLAAEPADAGGLGQAVGWAKSGWPPWSAYRPIAEAALGAKLPLRAGNPPRGLTRKIGRRGFAALGAARRRALGLEDAFPRAATESLERALFLSHCRLVPKEALAPMLRVQRARDAILAANLVAGAALDGADGALLIAGGGHARLDHGAPLHLARLAPGRSVLAVAFVEVEDGEGEPADYGESLGGAIPFDFVWFTPRADDRDHCAELKKRFGKAK